MLDMHSVVLRSEQEIMSQWDEKYEVPLVSVMCLTYNHEKYIEDALKGFLIQETEFPFEVLIHDDASTDRTADIIREYEKKYPHIVKPVYQKENQWSRDKSVIRKAQYGRVQGKYIALCEGDDYWTNQYKLQKQVDFLEKNKNYSVCFHLIESNKEDVAQYFNKKSKKVLTYKDTLKEKQGHTLSMVYKNECFSDEYIKRGSGLLVLDWAVELILLLQGKGYVINEVMGFYRKHESSVSVNKEFYKKSIEAQLLFLIRIIPIIKTNKKIIVSYYVVYYIIKYIKAYVVRR